MPIDPAMSGAMLGTFRDLLTSVQTQGSTGPDVEEMVAALADMDALAAQMSDVGEFSTTLANGAYYTRFTDAYTKVMLAAAGGGASAGGEAPPIPADEDLLAQSLQAYETSLGQLRTMVDQEVAIGALERIIAIGRSGISYPKFLRQVEDEALNDVLAGSVTPTREQLVAQRDLLASLVDPARVAHAEALIGARDELAAATGFADPFLYDLRQFELTAQHAPTIALRDLIVQRLPRLLDLVLDWLDSQTSWAAQDDRFRGDTDAKTRENIERARDCNPGFYEVRARQFASYFGSTPWWERPELGQERQSGRIGWTDARIALAIDVVAVCTPETPNAPAELIARAEAFGPNSF